MAREVCEREYWNGPDKCVLQGCLLERVYIEREVVLTGCVGVPYVRSSERLRQRKSSVVVVAIRVRKCG